MPDTTQLEFFENNAEQKLSAFQKLCDAWNVPRDGAWADILGKKLRTWVLGAENRQPINTLSLFSGAGGLDIGFHDAGFKIAQAVEIESKFAKSLEENAKEGGYIAGTEVICQDIREFSLPADTEIDFIIGGPPCQTFSAAGRRAAGVFGTNDARGTLFQEYVRLLHELQPAGFLFENVYGIVGAEGGEPWRQIQAAFRDVGYTISSRILDAADYGVAQHRERLIIVGTKIGHFRFPRPTHGPDSHSAVAHHSAESVLSDCKVGSVAANSELGGRYGHLLSKIPEGLNYSYFTEEMGHPKAVFAWRSKFSDFLYKADSQRPVRTIKAQGGQYTGPFHWDSRAFSVDELKRLQSFPDDYKIIGGKQVAIQQIGNSVPPQLARMLAISVLEQVFDQSLPIKLPPLKESDQLGFRKRKRELSNAYKAKARKAIGLLGARESISNSHRRYAANLTENFKWTEDASGSFTVEATVSEQNWKISIFGKDVGRESTPGIVVEVFPNPKNPWGLSAKSVRLKGFGPVPEVITALWKAFEAELVFHEVRADLVQLCGYYQYIPKFQAKVSAFNAGSWIGVGLRRIIEGHGVRKILSLEDLASAVHLDKSKIPEFVGILKTFGYEARNSETNPQIPSDSYLIPYAFPTLTNLSVQLRKSLWK